MTHQIASQEIARPMTLHLSKHILRSDLDVGRVDPGELGDFRSLFGEDRGEVGWSDGFAGFLFRCQRYFAVHAVYIEVVPEYSQSSNRTCTIARAVLERSQRWRRLPSSR